MKTLEQLDLTGVAKIAAGEFAISFPGPVFSSGRRTPREQAFAMASNVLSNRQWIKQTYVYSPVSQMCQGWIDGGLGKPMTLDEIGEGLLSVLSLFNAAALSRLTRHLSGEAFDVSPILTPRGAPMLAKLRSLAEKYRGKFLEREGGLIRWHWEALGA